MFEIGKILVIDNMDYVIASKTLCDDKIYLYLVNNKNEFMFCYVYCEDVVEISNIDEYDMIIPLLANESIKYLNENKKGN